MLLKEKLFPVFMIFFMLFSTCILAEDIKEIKVEKIKDEKKVIEESKSDEENSEPHYFTPLQFSFFSPLQIFPSYFRVYGLRANIPYGFNKSVGGIDVGIVNESENLYGLGCAALVSRRSGHMCGVNISGIYNLSHGSDNGFSFAGIYNEVHTINGIQMAALASRAKKVNGIQIGLLNTTHKMNGIQIGLLNYCKDQPFRYTFLFNFWDSGNDKEK